MKRLLTLTLFYLATQFAYGQACGIYRIEYVGNITTTNKAVVNIYLPTTMFLHRLEKEKSEKAFTQTTLTNGLFKVEIGSHLTTPYSNIAPLLSFYKKQSDKFKMKISSCVVRSSHLTTNALLNLNLLHLLKSDRKT